MRVRVRMLVPSRPGAAVHHKPTKVGGVLVPPGISGLALAMQGRASVVAKKVKRGLGSSWYQWPCIGNARPGFGGSKEGETITRIISLR